MRRVRSLAHPDPVRDWLMLLAISTMAFACLVVWNVWAFDRVARGGVIGEPSMSASPVFDQSSLDAVHTIFDDRATEGAKYARGVYQYADPSQ